MQLPSLDAHAHISPKIPSSELKETGAVLAMTLSLEEAALGIDRKEEYFIWGAGCHPRFPRAQEAFDIRQFEELTNKTILVGEVGLDGGARLPMALQLKNFRQILEVVSATPHLVSIHSFKATVPVLQELKRRPIACPILHWWTGSAEETAEAVELGCYFSIHSAVARQAKFRRWVPLERILVESDHGYNDPPAAIPGRIARVEHLVAQQYGLDVKQVRQTVWQNLAGILLKTGWLDHLPKSMKTIFSSMNSPDQNRLEPIKRS